MSVVISGLTCFNCSVESSLKLVSLNSQFSSKNNERFLLDKFDRLHNIFLLVWTKYSSVYFTLRMINYVRKKVYLIAKYFKVNHKTHTSIKIFIVF